MAKKSVMLLLIELLAIFIWLFFIGQMNSVSGISGDINLIDEGQFAAWINHMLHGKMMYKDFFVPYGPLQVYPLYLLVKFLGVSMFSIRLGISVIGVFLGISVAIIILKRLKVHPIIYIISLIFIVIYPGVHIRQWIGILCFLTLTESYLRNSKKLAFLSGVLLSISLLQSIEIGIFTTVICSGYILTRVIKTKNKRKIINVTGIVLLGFILSLSIFAGFAAKEGWLVNYIITTGNFITSVSGVNLPNGQGLPNVLVVFPKTLSPIRILQFIFSKQMLFYWSLLILLIFFSVTIIRYILKKTTQEDNLIFLILIFSLFTYTSIVGRSGHHLLFAPVVVVCSSYFLSLLFRIDMKDKSNKILSVVFFILFLLYITRNIIIFRYSDFLDIQKRQMNVTSVLRVAPIGISRSQAADIILLQDFFNKNTKPSDKIFIFNTIPAWYFLLDRENSTQYDLPILAISHEKRLELVSSLQKYPPKYILEDKKAWPVDDVIDRQRLPEVIQYIEKNYKKTRKIGHFVIHEIN